MQQNGDEFKELKQRRGIIKSQLTRFKNFLEDTENHDDIEQIDYRLDKINKHFDEFENFKLD